MSSAYEQTFGIRQLSGLAVAFGAEERMDSMFQALFSRGGTTTSDVDKAEWDEIQLARHLAPIRGANGLWPSSQGTVTINRESQMAHIKDSTFIPGTKLYKERAPGELRANARAKVRTELRNLVKKARKTIEYLAANTLNGTVTVSAATVPGSTQPFTISYSPNTYTASTTWKGAGTGLVSVEIPAAKRDFLQTSGLVPRRVIMDGTIADAFAANTEFQALMSDATKDRIAKGAAPLQGAAFQQFELAQLDWSVNEAGYVPEGGSFTKYIPATDDAFMLPGDEDLGEVLEMQLGKGLVPSGPGLASAAAAADLCALAPTHGFYAYAVRSAHPEPLGVHLCLGWVGLPILKFPSGVSVLDVVP